ncbi:MAG: hypothetical protein KGD68_10945 [Candidatus Lokiarchaeota archaeon]|nr:hypothetical protein [Candidatus Lokiarchaeota archaeon]
MKKNRNIEWGSYRHPEFLQSLNISVNELKFIKLFLKGGSVAMVNEVLRERKSKQYSFHKEDFSNRFHKPKKIKA